jgi:hypothetical protein
MADIEVVTSDGEVVTFRDGAPVAAGQWSPTALYLPEDTDFERWSAIGATLQSMDLSVKWWIGDWLRFGEHKYGETSPGSTNLVLAYKVSAGPTTARPPASQRATGRKSYNSPMRVDGRSKN